MDFLIIKIYIRFYIFIVIIEQFNNRDKIVYKTYINLNNCFKTNFINFIFVKLYNLQKISLFVFRFFKQSILYIYLFTTFNIFRLLRLIFKERLIYLFAFILSSIKTRNLKIILYCCRKRYLLIRTFIWILKIINNNSSLIKFKQLITMLRNLLNNTKMLYLSTL